MLIIANDGELIDTDKCESSEDFFVEETVWNGYEHIGKCSHMAHENSRQYLYPKDDRYYLTEITLPGNVTFCKRIFHQHAVKWLLYNNHRNLPDNLKHVLDEVL